MVTPPTTRRPLLNTVKTSATPACFIGRISAHLRMQHSYRIARQEKRTIPESKIPTIQNSKDLKSKNPKLQKSQNPKLQKSKTQKIQKSKNPKIQKTKNPKIQRSKKPKIQNFSHLRNLAQKFGFFDFWVICFFDMCNVLLCLYFAPCVHL